MRDSQLEYKLQKVRSNRKLRSRRMLGDQTRGFVSNYYILLLLLLLLLI